MFQWLMCMRMLMLMLVPMPMLMLKHRLMPRLRQDGLDAPTNCALCYWESHRVLHRVLGGYYIGY